MGEVTCTRCSKTAPGAEGVTWGGDLGEEIRTSTCTDCWAEWSEMEVKVINELRLNFMDPKSQDTLLAHLRKFLHLSGAEDLDLPDLDLPPDA